MYTPGVYVGLFNSITICGNSQSAGIIKKIKRRRTNLRRFCVYTPGVYRGEMYTPGVYKWEVYLLFIVGGSGFVEVFYFVFGECAVVDSDVVYFTFKAIMNISNNSAANCYTTIGSS